ncbi:MAG: DUF1259 domain-containing protein [Acidobacteriota bacterium]
MRLQKFGSILLLGSFAAVTAGTQFPAPEKGWAPLDKIFEQAGKDLPGGVHRFGWPRTDLRVAVRGVAIEPALALGSWAAFQATGNGDEAVALGDLVLLASEVNPVVAELQSNGIEVLAIHNHLIDETPRLMYVHFHARGEASALAEGLKAALGKTHTPAQAAAAPKSQAKLPEVDQSAFEKIQTVLGRRGALAGRVLQVGVPRAGHVEESGMEVPPSMGTATAMNFQLAGNRVAATGDFVLVADEVNPVVRELQAHGLLVTALHSHMLREEPRLFFLHFWGIGPPEKIAEGLKEALSKVATRP